MINKINTLRTVADKLTSHLILEGKTKITKPGAIIPGAVATAGITVILETKDNNANLIVKKGNNEIQQAIFNYDETPNGYKLASATSSYYYDDKDKNEIQQNHYLVEPKEEKVYEYSVNYANAPIKSTTESYIKKINSAIAKATGYKSNKTVYDQQESHTYGKKSLQRDIPALLKILDIIAPNTDFTLKMKDKLKKDNKTSLVAFEASNSENKNEIVRGFMSTDGDTVSYRLNTEDMIIIGEQSDNKNISKTYLKPEKNTTEQPINKSTQNTAQNKITTSEQVPKTKTTARKTKTKTDNPKTTENKPSVQTTVAEKQKNEVKTDIKIQTTDNNSNHIYPVEYYINLIFETATNENKTRGEKAKIYKETLALAYSDGYNKSELENILLGNGLLEFSNYCKKVYVEAGIELAEKSNLKVIAVETLEHKLKKLQKTKIDTGDEDIDRCLQNMINECVNIQDDAIKEAFVDKTLNLLKNNLSKNFRFDLLLFIQESSNINDDLKLHYEIYEEIVNDKKIKGLKKQIEQMINNVNETYHEQRDDFLTQLYIAKDIKDLELLQNKVQKLLNEQFSLQKTNDSTPTKQQKKLLLTSLSGTNQKIVRKLLTCKSPSDISLAFNEIRNLLLDIGFTESNVRGTHYKFIPPSDIFFNGIKQPFLTVAYQKNKSTNPAQIDDLIQICKQYYGS